MKNYSESTLKEKLLDLQKRIRTWAKNEDIWRDSGFKSYIDHFEDEPKEVPVVLIMYAEGEMGSVINGYNTKLKAEFHDIVESTEFYYDMYDHMTVFFYAKHEELNKAYSAYFEWEWVCKLLEPDYTVLYQELLEQLSQNVERQSNLSQDKFDSKIQEILNEQGYKRELGKGWSYGGTNLYLYQNNEIDEVVTLVWVKRNKSSLQISLECVQSCKPTPECEKANHEVFITSAKYLPDSKEFTDKHYKRITLLDSTNMKNWCNGTATRIIRDKSKLVTDAQIMQLISSDNKTDLEGSIVFGRRYYGYQAYQFCIILKDTVNASLLMKISTERLIEAGKNNIGNKVNEVPIVDKRILQNRTSENIFRADKEINFDGTISFWGNHMSYSIWDGKPTPFDY